MNRTRLAAGVLLAAAAGLALHAWQGWRHQQQLGARVAAIAAPDPASAIDCAALPAQRLTIVVLGQSNAGNHAARLAPAAPLYLVHQGRCYLAQAPLAGATGSGGSVWPALAAALGGRLHGRELVWSVVAVDASSIADWTGAGPLRRHWQAQLAALGQAGVRPDLVLWVQGEADARAGTGTAAYLAGLERLRDALRAAGLDAPLVLARSTRCGSADGAPVRAALAQFERAHPDVRAGADTDALQGVALREGCHFTAAGVTAAAALWAQALAR